MNLLYNINSNYGLIKRVIFKMNKYSSNASDFTSIFIPRVFANITKERITHIVENVVPLGDVERIDMVEIDEKTNRVWVHFTHWYDTEFVNEFKKLLMDETKQAKIVYDDPWFWIVLKNTHRLANGLPKIRLDLEDGEISKPQLSPKSTVTFTTSFVNPSKKKYSRCNWADVESDSDEDVLSPHPETRPISPSFPPPPPPSYPNPYQAPYYYPFPYYSFPFPYQYNQIPIAPSLQFQYPIAPSLPFQPHPVASWNGVSLDELYMDDIADDAFLTEKDYQEMLFELDDDDIYSDEDLYNMYLLEKEELALINQDGVDDQYCEEIMEDVIIDYFDTYGFDETTIVFLERSDAPLSSDSISTTNQIPKSRSISNIMGAMGALKDKIKDKVMTSPISATRPLKVIASSYKDMLVKSTSSSV